jgi:hypothetical protein
MIGNFLISTALVDKLQVGVRPCKGRYIGRNHKIKPPFLLGTACKYQQRFVRQGSLTFTSPHKCIGRQEIGSQILKFNEIE